MTPRQVDRLLASRPEASIDLPAVAPAVAWDDDIPQWVLESRIAYELELDDADRFGAWD